MCQLLGFWSGLALLASPTRLEVCLSPGCVADGAMSTFAKLQALSPPDKICVVAGGCQSACGMGPIVLDQKESTKLIHKRIKSDKQDGPLWTVLLADVLDEISPEMIHGYELCQDAKAHFLQKDFASSVKLYQEGIALAEKHAILNAAKAPIQNGISSSIPPQTIPTISAGTLVHPSLQWLLEAYRQLGHAQLNILDLEGAFQSALASIELSTKSDPMCFELLASVCQKKNDLEGELEALQSMFELIPTNFETLSPKVLPREISNKWRELGFRMATLQRVIK